MLSDYRDEKDSGGTPDREIVWALTLDANYGQEGGFYKADRINPQ
jgi:hypothetical protein